MSWKNRTDPAMGKQYPAVDKTCQVERMLVEEAYCSTNSGNNIDTVPRSK